MRTAPTKQIRFRINEKIDKISGLLRAPRGANSLLVLAHGAGAGMRHHFMEEVADKLAARAVATFRYQFPYMERGAKRPDPESVLTATVRAAVDAARAQEPGLRLFAGGKSMGGRMTSLAAAKQPLEGVRGLIFFGFPLHAAGKPGAERAKHLFSIKSPMLFLQGSRDTLADLRFLTPLCKSVGKDAELFIVDGGDHSFHLLKSSGRTDDQALDEIVEKVAKWTEGIA